MKLNKKTRERLYEADGRTITVKWPEDAPEPRSGHKYSVYGKDGQYLFRIVLERSKRLSYETKATIRIDGDPTRILPGLKGIRNDLGDYHPEPERIDRETEARYAMHASQRSALSSSTQRDLEAAERNYAKKGPGKFQERALENAKKARMEAA